jgi:hypothetical protein
MQQHSTTKNERRKEKKNDFWHIQTQTETGDGHPT